MDAARQHLERLDADVERLAVQARDAQEPDEPLPRKCPLVPLERRVEAAELCKPDVAQSGEQSSAAREAAVSAEAAHWAAAAPLESAQERTPPPVGPPVGVAEQEKAVAALAVEVQPRAAGVQPQASRQPAVLPRVSLAERVVLLEAGAAPVSPPVARPLAWPQREELPADAAAELPLPSAA